MHVTVRVAWHDNKWNGKVCNKPEENIYCIDNYSLLSSRIQRRRDLNLEQDTAGKEICEVWKNIGYVPPCYWCINLNGNANCTVKDPHPFSDTNPKFGEKVPPIDAVLHPNSVYTWNFKLSFDVKKGNYRYPPDLEERVKEYINKIKPGSSIVFFYANYGNPINGDERKYLLVGAALVKNIEYPSEYEMPPELIEEKNKDWRTRYFPKIAWQFSIDIDPETIVLLPYHEYLDLEIREEEKENLLKEITVSIKDPTLIPHFKYVSMHVPSDKAIYLLYEIKRKLDIVEQHGIIDFEEVQVLKKRIVHLLKIAWDSRGKYPGFRNLMEVLISDELKNASETVDEFYSLILQKFGSVEEFLANPDNIKVLESENLSPGLKRIIPYLRDEYSTIEFLSRFDLSKPQFQKILGRVNRYRENPYTILEEYLYELQDNNWRIEDNDYGISLYQIDIPMFPDPEFVNWEPPMIIRATSIERVSALITTILKESATIEGNSALLREMVMERIKSYPLYYIDKELNINENLLDEYENRPEFRSKFIFYTINGKKLYQLKSLRNIEAHIEKFVNTLISKTYSVPDAIVEELVERDIQKFDDRLNYYSQITFSKERQKLYNSVLKNGFSVILGSAGSGKTAAVVNLVKYFNDERKPILIVTPTGKASLVIRDRLKKEGINPESSRILVSTIHRYLYQFPHNFSSYIPKILDGNYHLFQEFIRGIQNTHFKSITPKVVIIDEASMVDEVLLALLFATINPHAVEHVILVGDDKQLPPIGVGRPLVDIVNYLKAKNLEGNYVELQTNLRFSTANPGASRIEKLAALFREDKMISFEDLEDVFQTEDETLEIVYFESYEDLIRKLKEILSKLTSVESTAETSISELFVELFEPDGTFDYSYLDQLQILAPRRVGRFGTLGINYQIAGDILSTGAFKPGTKIICEENQYWNIGDLRVLALANGSIGYLPKKDHSQIKNGLPNPKFYDIDELYKLVTTITNKIQSPKKRKWYWDSYKQYLTSLKKMLVIPGAEKNVEGFSPAYAITVHKAQGSDFDNVILVLSERSNYITKELIYTGITRAKKKLYLFIHESLKDKFYEFLISAHENSAIDNITTLLFEYRPSASKPYKVTLKDGKTLYVRSKIEMIIAKTLDNLGVEFEYEPKDFSRQYLLPDFKIIYNEQEYYWEHLGMIDNMEYRSRWFRKFEKYKEIGVADHLITTEEYEYDIENNVRKIIEDIKEGRLKGRQSYSYHHYFL
jgi:exodeoxyribonuclease V alpha subunit